MGDSPNLGESAPWGRAGSEGAGQKGRQQMSQLGTIERPNSGNAVIDRGLDIRIKSIREAASPDDGRRILVNRFWPPGVTKVEAALSEWHQNWAPSWPLRQWFDYSEDRWPTFCERYRAELVHSGKIKEVLVLAELSKRERVTLVFTGASPERNVAAALLRFIQEA
jgi:uncharacterized protein YeaO (DUF488 family)